jgi:RNA polymerase sigma-70 factor (ECF subfamily)
MGWRWFGRQQARSAVSQAAVSTADSVHLLLMYQREADPQLLQQLFLRYADALYHFLLKQCDAELAQDLSQQSWLQLMQHAASYQGQSSVKTWLFSIGRNLLVDELRRRRPMADADILDSLADDASRPLQHLLHAEQNARLSLAIASLPYVQREALLLQLEDFSLAQIAEITGTGAETVKTRLRYARQTLQQWLNPAPGVNNETGR